MIILNNMKIIFRMLALVVFLLPISVLAVSLQNETLFTKTVNNQYKIEGSFTGNTANNANLNASSSLDLNGITDGTMTFKATDLTGLNGNISVRVTDGNNTIAAGNGEVTVSISDLKNASAPMIQASAAAATQGDLQRGALNYSYPINIADNNNNNNNNTANRPLPFVPAARNPAPDPATAENNSANDSAGGGSANTNKGLVPCDGLDCSIEKIKTMGARIYNYLTGFGAILAVGAIVWAGFSYIKAQGEPSEMAAAKKIIVNAIIGLVALATSALIVNTVLNWAGKTGDATKVESVTAK